MLSNDGFEILGNSDPEPPSGIVVVGLSRGGTSAVAQSLHALGISLGSEFKAPNYEDRRLGDALRSKRWREMKRLIREYEASSGGFAWKMPNIDKHLYRIHRYFQRPAYIFVYRDIFAVAARRAMVHEVDPVESMSHALAGYQRILSFVRRKQPHALHVSYEKLLSQRESYARMLLTFCGMPLDPERIAAVVDATAPYPEAYQRWAAKQQQRTRLRKAGFDGVIDSLNQQRMVGWLLGRVTAAQPCPDPVRADLYLNDEFLTEVVADQERKGLVEAGVSPTARVGFRVDLADVALRDGDVAELRIRGADVTISQQYYVKSEQKK